MQVVDAGTTGKWQTPSLVSLLFVSHQSSSLLHIHPKCIRALQQVVACLPLKNNAAAHVLTFLFRGNNPQAKDQSVYALKRSYGKLDE